MNKSRKERQSTQRWDNQTRELSRAYCARMRKAKKEREKERESEAGTITCAEEERKKNDQFEGS